MVRETWVQSQVESYQKFFKCYLVRLCFTLSNIRYVSRVKWNNSGKGVAPPTTPRCRSYWKESLLVAFDYGRQLYLLIILMRVFLASVSWCYCKSPQVSRTLLSILADLNNEVVWLVSTHPLIFNPPTPVPNHWWLYCSHRYNWYHRHFHVP